MHELSVASEICRMAEEHLGGPGMRLLELGVEIGDDAGFEPESLLFCLEALLAEPPFSGARPVLVRVPGDVLRLKYLEVDDGRADD